MAHAKYKLLEIFSYKDYTWTIITLNEIDSSALSCHSNETHAPNAL